MTTKLLAKVEIGTYGIMLRYTKGSALPYVTHQFNSAAAVVSGRYSEGNYWGHYFHSESLDEAVIDFFTRVMRIHREQQPCKREFGNLVPKWSAAEDIVADRAIMLRRTKSNLAEADWLITSCQRFSTYCTIGKKEGES